MTCKVILRITGPSLRVTSYVINEEILERLQDICKKEGVRYELGGLEAIIFTADGDMRSAVNALQVCMP